MPLTLRQPPVEEAANQPGHKTPSLHCWFSYRYILHIGTACLAYL